jgi:hypothetical protein
MGVTVFPAGVHAASTWDTELMFKRGEALGQEAKGLGVHVQLGPVAGPLGKIPHGGRNWEGLMPPSDSMKFILILSSITRLLARSLLNRNCHARNDPRHAKRGSAG